LAFSPLLLLPLFSILASPPHKFLQVIRVSQPHVQVRSSRRGLRCAANSVTPSSLPHPITFPPPSLFCFWLNSEIVFAEEGRAMSSSYAICRTSYLYFSFPFCFPVFLLATKNSTVGVRWAWSLRKGHALTFMDPYLFVYFSNFALPFFSFFPWAIIKVRGFSKGKTIARKGGRSASFPLAVLSLRVLASFLTLPGRKVARLLTGSRRSMARG